jgi:hypothetical protein
MCTENYVKDRRSSDQVEGYNLAIGATDELKMLIGGVTSSSAFFSTLIASRPKFLEDHYENVASLIQQRCGISLLHMRNVAVGFSGTVEFRDD